MRVAKDSDDVVLKFDLWHLCVHVECLAFLTIDNVNLEGEHYTAILELVSQNYMKIDYIPPG